MLGACRAAPHEDDTRLAIEHHGVPVAAWGAFAADGPPRAAIPRPCVAESGRARPQASDEHDLLPRAVVNHFGSAARARTRDLELRHFLPSHSLVSSGDARVEPVGVSIDVSP